MKLEVIATRVNSLLGRKEISFQIEQSATPSRMDVTKELVGLMKAAPDRVCVVKLQTHSGTQMTRGRAHIYDSATQAQFVEPKHVVQRNSKTKEEKKEED